MLGLVLAVEELTVKKSSIGMLRQDEILDTQMFPVIFPIRYPLFHWVLRNMPHMIKHRPSGVKMLPFSMSLLYFWNSLFSLLDTCFIVLSQIITLLFSRKLHIHITSKHHKTNNKYTTSRLYYYVSPYVP